MPLESGNIESVFDYVCWYSKDIKKLKYRNLFAPKNVGGSSEFVFADTDDGGFRRLTSDEIENFEASSAKLKIFKRSDLASSGYTPSCTFPLEFKGQTFKTSGGKSWRTTPAGIESLKKANRLFVLGQKIYFKMYLSDFGYTSLTNSWQDTIEFGGRIYAVQTTATVIQRCLQMTTDPGDLVLDITCGSGTTAYVAEQWGRRWITCDTSRVALTLAKQRLMTAAFPYYRLAHEDEGVDSGFRYTTVPHTTLKTIANNEQPELETLYDDPLRDNAKARVTGPFTVEAVPAPMVKSPSELSGEKPVAPMTADASVSRSGATVRHDEWRNELLRSGIRGKGGQMIQFSRVEPLLGTRWIHADAETKSNDKDAVKMSGGVTAERQRVVISFGQEHAPLEQRQVEYALEEARRLVPKPQLVVFASFQFDPEAAKDIDELNWPGVTVLKAQMNADLFTEDLKKKRTSNESFWLIGQPDVMLRKSKTKPKDAKDKTELWEVEVKGFDYYNTKTGQIDSGGADKIAVWMLDTDYDGRSLFPRQVFFPMAGQKEGWTKLAKNLKAEIDDELIEAYRGTISLPFSTGTHGRVAVKIVDDRGIESLKMLDLP